MKVTWRKKIEDEMIIHNDNFENLEYNISERSNWLDIEFNDSYGSVEGFSFTLWTKDRVYFPVQYDGSEWCKSVPRNPCEEITGHIGWS